MNNFILIIPVRNAEKWIEAALTSVYKSSTVPTNLIIVDDQSTDDTLSVISSFHKRNQHPRIIDMDLLQLNEHKNQYYAKNAAIRWIIDYESINNNCLVGFLDADDICYQNRFEKQLNILNTHPNVWAVGGACHNIKTTEEADDIITNNAWPMEENPLIKGLRQFGIGLWNATAVYHWQVIEALGSFDFTPTMGDTEWFLRLVWASSLYNKEIRNVQEPVIHRRVHDTQVSNTSSNSQSPLRVAYEAMCRQKFIYFKTLQNLGKLNKDHLYRANEVTSDNFRVIT